MLFLIFYRDDELGLGYFLCYFMVELVDCGRCWICFDLLLVEVVVWFVDYLMFDLVVFYWVIGGNLFFVFEILVELGVFVVIIVRDAVMVWVCYLDEVI